MKHQIEKIIKNNNGTEFKITAGLILSETIDADGHKVTVDCCRKSGITAEVIGRKAPIQYGLSTAIKSQKIDHPTEGRVVALIGKVALNTRTLSEVNAIIAELETHPAWIAKEKAEEASDRVAADLARRAPTCPRCGGYCDGDCEAN